MIALFRHAALHCVFSALLPVSNMQEVDFPMDELWMVYSRVKEEYVDFV